MNCECDLGDAFVKRIDRRQGDIRQIYYRVVEGKHKSQRAGSTQSVKFIIEGQMSIRYVSMKLLLSHTGTKSQLTEYFGKRLLDKFAGRAKRGLLLFMEHQH